MLWIRCWLFGYRYVYGQPFGTAFDIASRAPKAKKLSLIDVQILITTHSCFLKPYAMTPKTLSLEALCFHMRPALALCRMRYLQIANFWTKKDSSTSNLDIFAKKKHSFCISIHYRACYIGAVRKLLCSRPPSDIPHTGLKLTALSGIVRPWRDGETPRNAKLPPHTAVESQGTAEVRWLEILPERWPTRIASRRIWGSHVESIAVTTDLGNDLSFGRVCGYEQVCW